MKSKIMIFLLLISVAGFSQIRHDQLRKPVIESTDTVLMFKNTSMGFEYTRTVLDTTIINGLDLFVKERVSDSTNYLIGILNDTVTYILGQIPTNLAELDSSGFRITENQISDLKNYLTTEVDPVYSLDSAKIVWFKDLKFTQDSLKISADSIQAHNLRLLGKQSISDTLTYDATKYDLEQLKLIDLDSTGFSVDTTQVRDLLEFVQNNGGGGSGDSYWEETNVGSDTIVTNSTLKLSGFTMGESNAILSKYVSIFNNQSASELSFEIGDENVLADQAYIRIYNYNGEIQYRTIKPTTSTFELQKSIDKGLTWVTIKLDNVVTSLSPVISCSNDGSVIALGYDTSSGRKTFVSTNSGLNWDEYVVNVGLGNTYRYIRVSQNGDWCLVGTDSGSSSAYYGKIDTRNKLGSSNVLGSAINSITVYSEINNDGNFYYYTNANANLYVRVGSSSSLITTLEGGAKIQYHDNYIYYSSDSYTKLNKFPVSNYTNIQTVLSGLTGFSTYKIDYFGNVYWLKFLSSNSVQLFKCLSGETTFTQLTQVFTISYGAFDINYGSQTIPNVNTIFSYGALKFNTGKITMSDSYIPESSNDLIDKKYFLANSAGSFNLKVMEYDGTPLVQNTNTLMFNNATVSDLGNGQVLITPSGGSGSTNLSVSRDGSTVVVNSDTGTDAYLYTASSSYAGIMTSSDKLKLDGIAYNANNYTLPVASGSILGGIKVGSGLSIDGNGVLSSSGGSMVYPSGSGIPTINSGAWGTTISPSNGYLNYNNGTWSFSTPSGGGDMFKATYDTNSNNVVDNSEALGGVASSNYATLTGSQTLTNKSVNGVTLSTSQGTSNFLRGDGTYAATPSGVGGSNNGHVLFNASGSVGGDNNFQYIDSEDLLRVRKLDVGSFMEAKTSTTKVDVGILHGISYIEGIGVDLGKMGSSLIVSIGYNETATGTSITSEFFSTSLVNCLITGTLELSAVNITDGTYKYTKEDIVLKKEGSTLTVLNKVTTGSYGSDPIVVSGINSPLINGRYQINYTINRISGKNYNWRIIFNGNILPLGTP